MFWSFRRFIPSVFSLFVFFILLSIFYAVAFAKDPHQMIKRVYMCLHLISPASECRHFLVAVYINRFTNIFNWLLFYWSQLFFFSSRPSISYVQYLIITILYNNFFESEISRLITTTSFWPELHSKIFSTKIVRRWQIEWMCFDRYVIGIKHSLKIQTLDRRKTKNKNSFKSYKIGLLEWNLFA